MNRIIKMLALSLLVICMQTTIAQPIKRIISLAPSLTMNLYYLKVQDRLVGCTSYCEIAKKDKKTIVATAVKVNLEKVVSLKPDLVIATGLTDPETLETLRKLGIKVELFQTAKSFDEICVHFLRLGKLIGKEAEANKVIAKSKADVERLKKACAGKSHPKIFFQIGAKPIFTVLPHTFMDDFITFCGGTNIAADLTKGSMTKESVLERNPDVVIVTSMGIVGEDEKKVWESYSQLSAAKKKQIYVVDSNLACTPTPVSFVQTFETLAKYIIKGK